MSRWRRVKQQRVGSQTAERGAAVWIYTQRQGCGLTEGMKSLALSCYCLGYQGERSYRIGLKIVSGNGVVPQVVEQIGYWILDRE